MGLFGPPNVEKLAAKRDLKGLAKALTNDDAGVRESAARALVELDDPNAVPVIVERLTDHHDDEAVIDAAAGVLRAMGDSGVPYLAAGLQDGTASLERRSVCGGLLGRMGEAHGLAPLVEATRDGEPAPRGIAALSLALIGGPEAAQRITELFKDDEDMEVRGIAAVALASHKLPGAYETLVAALKDPEPVNRALGATGLGILGDKRAAVPLDGVATGDDDERVRNSAQSALADLNV